MYRPTDEELLLLQWAIAAGLYSPSFFSVDQSLADVWLRLFRSLDVSLGVDRYWRMLEWLNEAGKSLALVTDSDGQIRYQYHSRRKNSPYGFRQDPRARWGGYHR